ncbi:MAG: Hsp20/alpha crystallin family protein [Gammaproteobacteria bacterium]|jgi:HSP20 family protein|nr:MAG: Hsp20/alpha crystallin family protein [Gammaproteobacteria bacterium]
MDTDRIKEDFGNTWKRLAEGWRHLSGKAAHALTYFAPTRSDEAVEDARWGILAADVTERDDAFLVELEAPGLEKEEIDVSVEDQRLIITGTKRYESDRKEGAMRITERAFGSFQRVIPLPEKVTADGAEATYKRGVLSLKVPKVTAPSVRKISVSSG